MAGMSDKIKGLGNEAAGNVKQGVGKVIGSDKMQAEGALQETKREAQRAIGDTKETVADGYDAATRSSTADTIAGNVNAGIGKVKQAVGRAVGSPKVEADGLAQESKGEAQKVSGDVKDTIDR